MAEYVIERERGYDYFYYPFYVVARVVNAIVGLIESILVLRLVLQFSGANATSPFVGWVYGISNSFIGPFAGSFPVLLLGAFAIDLSIIFAMIGYAIIGWLIYRLLALILTTTEAV